MSKQQQQQQQQQQQATAAAVSTPTIRRSCNHCGDRKKKCDGDGVNRCSRCARKRQPCVYSLRRPRPCTVNIRPLAEGAAAGLQQPVIWKIFDDQPSESNARAFTERPQSPERSRMSASPATGLVGMEENSLLGKYFDTLGCMSMAPPSIVREGMMKVLIGAADTTEPLPSQREPMFAEQERQYGAWDGVAGTQTASRVEVSGSVCTFWCAVAVGGILQGRPLEAVAEYMEQAKAALSYKPIRPEAGLTRGYIELAFLHYWIGDWESFVAYQEHAKECTRGEAKGTQTPEELPEDLVMMLHYSNLMGFFSETLEAQMASMRCLDDIPRPSQDSTIVANELDASRYLLFAYARIWKAIFVTSGHATSDDSSEHLEVSNASRDGRQKCGVAAAAAKKLDANGGSITLSARVNICDKIDELAPVFSRLEQFESLPQFQHGVGQFCFNKLFTWICASRRDMEGLLSRTARCVDVMAINPGLCRGIAGSHHSHYFAAILADNLLGAGEATGKSLTVDKKAADYAIELYGKLRSTFNSMRGDRVRPIPPLKEWKGVRSLCDHVFCRSISEVLVAPGVNAVAKLGILEKVDALVRTGDKRKLAESARVEETNTDKSHTLWRSSPSGVFASECLDNSEDDLTNNVLLAADEGWDGVGDVMIGPIGNDSETQEMMSCKSWHQYEQSLPLAEDWLLFARSLSSDDNGASDGE